MKTAGYGPTSGYMCPMTGKRDVTIVALAAMAGALAICGAVRAEPEAAPNEDGAVVMIAERNDTATAEVVVRAVQAQLSDVSVALHVIWVDALASDLPSQISKAEEVAKGSAAVAVIWCDLVRADRIYLYFAAPSGGRVLVRELAGSGTGGMAEALAIIVRSSVEAVLAGGEIGTVVPPKPKEEESDKRPQSAVAKVKDEGRLAVTAAYELDVMSTSNLAVHAAAVALSLRLGDHVSLGVGYALSGLLEAETDGAFLKLRRHPVWIGGSVFGRAGRVRLGLDLAFQLDVVTERTRATAAGVVPANGGHEVEPSIVPMFRVAVTVIPHLELFVAAGADIALRRTRYLVDTPDGSVELLTTWPVRPRVIAGLEAALW